MATPNTSMTNSGADRTGTEVGQYEHGLSGTGGNRWDTRGGRGGVKKDGLTNKTKII